MKREKLFLFSFFLCLPSGRSKETYIADDRPSIVTVIRERSESTEIECVDVDISNDVTSIFDAPILFYKIAYRHYFAFLIMQYCHSIQLKPGKVGIEYIIFTFTNDPRIPPREEDEVWTICPPVADDILLKRSNPANDLRARPEKYYLRLH